MIEVDASFVARGLGLEPEAFRPLMDAGKITTLCERGVGDDAGRFRFTFYHGKRRFRFETDAAGQILPPQPAGSHRAGPGPP